MRVAPVSISGHGLLSTGNSRQLRNGGPTSKARGQPLPWRFVSPTTACHFDLFVSVSLFGPLGFCICSGQATGQTSGCGKLSKSMKSLGWLGHGGVGGAVGQFLPVSMPMGWRDCELLQCKQVSFLSSSVLVMVKMVLRRLPDVLVTD